MKICKKCGRQIIEEITNCPCGEEVETDEPKPTG